MVSKFNILLAKLIECQIGLNDKRVDENGWEVVRSIAYKSVSVCPQASPNYNYRMAYEF